MSNNPGPLPLKMAQNEAIRLSQLQHELAVAYAAAKQLYISKFPDCPRPYITCGYRSNEEQARLYAQGRTTPGQIVTHAKPGTSKHNSNPSAAFDVGFVDATLELDWTNQQFREFAALVKAQNSRIVWGGNFKSFKDLPHFQLGE